MLRQARRISWICTAGEMGALLLEARLIKEQQPLFNKRLRRNRQLCSLQLSEQKIEVVSARSVDFSHEPNLFGLFANRRAALQSLQNLADEQKLCYGLLGLEPVSRGRACFRFALKRCAGACCGQETPQAHFLRLQASLERLRVVCWPWKGAIALKESRPQMTQFHIINNWLWLGAVPSLDEAATLVRTPAGFDQDGYKILCKPLMSGQYEIIELHTDCRQSKRKPPILSTSTIVLSTRPAVLNYAESYSAAAGILPSCAGRSVRRFSKLALYCFFCSGVRTL
ncbi:nucleotide excision repair endonuclease [Salmonella enterica subsp. enterica serovar Typhimurium str. DT104]|nr:nucleotide excision repair endonuclease [Salmonella enterica subsp. enterica serovar Typhimurium str. DT104]